MTLFAISRSLVIFLAIVFWLSLASWVYKDGRRRMGRPMLVRAATLGSLVPFVGPLVYLLFRPTETLDDVRARDAELQALEQQLRGARPTCRVCSSMIEPDYLVCPVCTTRLRHACATCGAPLDTIWQVCPYCASAIGPEQQDLDAALTAELRSIPQERPAPPTPVYRTRATDR